MSLPLSDVGDFVALVANIGLVVSLFFLVYQILLQRKELKYSVYEKLMSDFSNISLLLVEHPELRKIYNGGNKPKNWDKYDDDEKTMYCYFDSLLGLFERVWVSYKEMRWLNREDWGQWKNWIRDLARNEIFVDVVNDNKELYDPSFINEVQETIK